MQEKYEKLFYELTPEAFDGGDWSNCQQMYFHGEKDLEDAVMYTGYQIITAPVQMEQEPIFHREMENLVFLGADLPDVFKNFDAEIHFYMGPSLDKMEKIVVTEPTLIKVPKGWWHSPLTFVRVDKPVLFQAVLFAGKPGSLKLVQEPGGGTRYEYSEAETHRRKWTEDPAALKSVPWTVINEDGVALYSDKGAYDPEKAPSSLNTVIRPGYKSKPYGDDSTALKAPKPALTEETTKCVLALPKEVTGWGEWCPSPQAYFRGDIYMENATYNVGWQIFTGPNDMEEPHFHQGVDEYIFFTGSNPLDLFDFDCEIEFLMGDDPDHLESKIITRPTVVRLPPTVWHCPIKFRKMKKPVMFQAAFMHGTWGTITRSTAEKDKGYFDRKWTYDYMGDNVRFCRFDDKKRCNICGKCFPKPDIQE